MCWISRSTVWIGASSSNIIIIIVPLFTFSRDKALKDLSLSDDGVHQPLVAFILVLQNVVQSIQDEKDVLPIGLRLCQKMLPAKDAEERRA